MPPTVDTTVIDEHNQHHYKTQIGMVMNIANAQASEEYDDLTVEGAYLPTYVVERRSYGNKNNVTAAPSQITQRTTAITLGWMGAASRRR